MEKTQFDTLMLAITGLKADTASQIANLDTKVTAFRDEVKQEFKQVRQDIEALADQLGKTVSDVKELKRRIEGPSA